MSRAGPPLAVRPDGLSAPRRRSDRAAQDRPMGRPGRRVGHGTGAGLETRLSRGCGMGRSSMVWAVEGFEPLAEVGPRLDRSGARASDTATGTSWPSGAWPWTCATRRPSSSGTAARSPCSASSSTRRSPASTSWSSTTAGRLVITEFVDGVSLRALLDRAGPLEPEAALYVAKGVLLGLREVHARGIVHRALRPENVFIDSTGTVKVVDIGLIRRAATGCRRTRHTPHRSCGRAAEPTPTSDVYAAAQPSSSSASAGSPAQHGVPRRLRRPTWLAGGSALTADAAIAALRSRPRPGAAARFLTLGLAADPSVAAGRRRRPRWSSRTSPRSPRSAPAGTTLGSRWSGSGFARPCPGPDPATVPPRSRRAPRPWRPRARDGADPGRCTGPDRKRRRRPAVLAAPPVPAVRAAAPDRQRRSSRWSGGGCLHRWAGDQSRRYTCRAAPVRPPGQAVHARSRRLAPDADPARPRRGRTFRLLIGLAVLLLAAVGTGFALTVGVRARRLLAGAGHHEHPRAGRRARSDRPAQQRRGRATPPSRQPRPACG